MVDRKELRNMAHAVADSVNVILDENAELKTTIQQVRELPDKWRDRPNWASIECHIELDECANELEALLKGDSNE